MTVTKKKEVRETLDCKELCVVTAYLLVVLLPEVSFFTLSCASQDFDLRVSATK